MSDLQKKFNKIVSDIEKNLKNQEDIEYVKTQIYNMYNVFIEEFEELEAKSTEKIESLLIRYKVIEDRMSDIEDSIGKIENDIYIKESEDYDFEIECPYCEAQFTVDCSNGIKDTVKCPECNHVIELDWNEHEGCSHDCCDCENECDEHEDDNDDDDM